MPQSEWCSLVAGGCHCRLCGYTTPLRANFSLHCQTDRHRARYQLAAHVREGDGTAQECAALVAKGNAVQLRCRLCDHVTNSLEKLQAHCLSATHEAAQHVYRFLQRFDGAVAEGLWLFHCLPCNFSCSAKLHMLRHAHSAAHQQREGLLRLQPVTEGGPMEGEELAAIFTIRKCSTPDAGEWSEEMEASAESPTGPSDQTKDADTRVFRGATRETDGSSVEERERRDSLAPAKRSSPVPEETENFLPSKRPRTHQHTTTTYQQIVQCPLCQVKLAHTHLRQHLTHLHSVAQDCVDKLISTVVTSVEQPESPSLPEPGPDEVSFQTDGDSYLNDPSTKEQSHTAHSLEENGMSPDTAEGDANAPKDVTALLTPPLDDQHLAETNVPHLPNGRAAAAPPSLSPCPSPSSSPSLSPPGDAPHPSDRHGYRFRCSKCSLAFPTQEKLQVHWQYHAMRAATECPLCSRQCRSQEALQRHLQNSHSLPETATHLEKPQADAAHAPTDPVQQAQVTSHGREEDEEKVMETEGRGADGGEGEEEEQQRAEDGDEKKECVSEREDGILEKAERSGLGVSEAVLARHQEEAAESEPGHSLPSRRGPNSTMDRYLDPSRPYKCSVCSESFTQKTILLVHYNSVSHLHRARRTLQDSGPPPADAPRGPDPRPYRCKVCGVGYSQSSTLDIHLRSVLHQTRARAVQMHAAPQSLAPSPAPPTAQTISSSCPSGAEDSSRRLASASPSTSARADAHASAQAESLQTKRRVADLLASRGQQTLMLLQQQQHLAQAQAQLQQHSALLQSQLFNPALLQHLPLGPDALLKQHFLMPDNLLSLQQQLLLPFYLSGGGDMNLGPELTLPKVAESSPTVLAPSPPMEQPRGGAERDPAAPSQTPEQQAQRGLRSGVDGEDQVRSPCASEDDGETQNDLLNTVKTEPEVEQEDGCDVGGPPVVSGGHAGSDGQVDSTGGHSGSVGGHSGSGCPPPRVPYAAASGDALRALLGSYGYELALQYTQASPRHQQRNAAPPGGPEEPETPRVDDEEESEETRRIELTNVETGREKRENGHAEPTDFQKDGGLEERECGECGKLFSDSLVLKSHQEYEHRLLLPPAMLERFSREYRLKYDHIHPLMHATPEENTTPLAPAQDPEPATSPTKSPSSSASTPSPAKAVFTPSTAKTLPTPSPAKAPSTPSPAKAVLTPSLAKAPSTPSPAKALSTPSPVKVLSTPSPAKALTPAPPPCTPPPPSPSQPETPPQPEAATPGTPAPSPPSPQPKASIPLPLPQLPLLSLPLPQLPLPPLSLGSQLPVPPLPFPLDLPLLAPGMMQSMALQSQALLSSMDPTLTPDLTKFYQSQLNHALTGQQAQLSPVLLGQQSQLSPALLGQQSQLSPALLGQQPQLSPALLGQQPQLSPALPGQQQLSKRGRTRISEEQLNVLRQHFDISSLPGDEQVNKMAALSGLPHKVIKHWFRNTLFKERQRDKDSPYNFSNPPTTPLGEAMEDVAPVRSLSDAPPSSSSPSAPPAQNSPPQAPRQDTHRGDLHRGRRSSRTRFTEEQLDTLQGVFEANPYPREEEYDRLSALLSLPNRIIVVWFQNARQRARKTQERGGGDGGREGGRDEGTSKSSADGGRSQTGSRRKGDEDDNDDDDDEEGQCSSQNENSMDLAYEYYTHVDSPCLTPILPDPLPQPLAEPQANTADGKRTLDKAEANSIKEQAECTERKQPSEKNQAEDLGRESRPQRRESQAPAQLKSSQPTLASPPQKSGRTCDSSGSQSSPAVPPLQRPPAAPEAQQSQLTQAQGSSQAQPQFQCSLCPLSLPSFQLWQEHQTRHLLAAQSQVQLLHPGFTDRPPLPYMMLHPNHTLLASQLLSGAMSQMHPGHHAHPMMSHMAAAGTHPSLAHAMERTHASSSTLASPRPSSKVPLSEGRQGGDTAAAGAREREEEQRRDKRQRTTITPEQLEVLYQRYSLDSNPTRGVLEGIARDVALGRRVVQVWFQNTRARERKGQFRSLGAGAGLSLSHAHLRCPFCRALFKVKSALDAHVRSRHWSEAERGGYSLSLGGGGGPAGHSGDTSSFSYRDRPCPSVSSYPAPSPHGGLGTSSSTREPEAGNTALTSEPLTFDLTNPEGEDEGEELEEGDDEFACEEGSSLADQASSPGPDGAHGGPTWGERCASQAHHQHHLQSQQQRQRTHMSHLQVLQLRAFYRNHRTPSRLECEALGQELGLARRVVQVWFQNARAKEKRARCLSSDPAAGEEEQMELSAGAGERDRA